MGTYRIKEYDYETHKNYWVNKKAYLESQIKLRGNKISNHEKYIKKLENDINKL